MSECENFEGVWLAEGVETTINLNTGDISKKNSNVIFEIKSLEDNAYSILLIINSQTKIQLIGYTDKFNVLINNGTDTSIFYFVKNQLIHSYTETDSDKILSATFKLYRKY
jgi:hypothetical protein